MKKLFTAVIISSIAFVSASNAITRGEIEENPLLMGKMLAKRCAWCHDINRIVIAPPFKTILERYKNVPDDTLKKQFAEVIKNGSKGKWTKWMKEHIKAKKLGNVEAMYMPPQKPYYNDKEIELIVNWLLSLRK